MFVTPEEFRKQADEGGFLEWAEFLGNLYGTPIPTPPPGSDVLLEIDVQGAEQVLEKYPDAIVMLFLPPSQEVQQARLLARGDPEEHVRMRMQKGLEEVERGRRLARYEVVNASLDEAVTQLAGIVSRTRKDAHAS